MFVITYLILENNSSITTNLKNFQKKLVDPIKSQLKMESKFYDNNFNYLIDNYFVSFDSSKFLWTSLKEEFIECIK